MESFACGHPQIFSSHATPGIRKKKHSNDQFVKKNLEENQVTNFLNVEGFRQL